MSCRVIQSRASGPLALVAAAIYAAIATLGYGLHDLGSCGHRHADHVWGPADASQHADHDHPAGGSLASTPDDCSICSFLAQAQSSVAPAPALNAAEPLAAAPQRTVALAPELPADSPLARGPPTA
jgi:hypothetical protein